jgi:allantoinase
VPDIFTDLDYRIRANEQDIEYLSHLEQATYSHSGQTQFSISVPAQPPAQTKFSRFRPAPIAVQKPFEESDKNLLYFNYLANFPDYWETHGVKKVLKTSVNYELKVHICNLSSASAVNSLLKRKASQVTCDTAAHFLALTDADIQRGDTRLKCCPPIRNRRNCNLMWELLKLNAINMITSQHRAVPPSYKFLREGSFKQAVSGISSLGYALQQVWTKLRVPCESEAEMEHYLVRLSKWMSLQPAMFLGISDTRGSIAKGKLADLIIWDPYSRTIASGPNGQFPEVFPYTGQVFYGVVHKVMIRGQIACENGKAKSFGAFVGLTALD